MKITNAQIGYNGRLGNQLFQFASLFGLSKIGGKQLVIPRSNTSPVNQCLSNGEVFEANFVLDKIFLKISDFFQDFDAHNEFYKTVKEGHFIYDGRVSWACQQDYNINLEGYFQSPLYFNDYREELLDILSFEYEFKPSILDKPIVSIHVRRGDYLSLPENHPICSHEYYKSAISYFGDCYFRVFSDDIEWCKSVFVGEKFSFSDNTTERDDLQRMSICDHHIIANSSFSWWAAYLNRSESKKIIAPKNWFGQNYNEHDTSQILSIADILI